MPMMTGTPVTAAPTALALTMTQQQVDDEFDDIINGGFFDDDDRDDDSKSCSFHIGECNQIAKFWLALPDEQAEDGLEKRYFCPRHFALRLHLILDALRRNVYFDEQTTPAQIRDVLHSYYCGWGRCREF